MMQPREFEVIYPAVGITVRVIAAISELAISKADEILREVYKMNPEKLKVNVRY